ncbi:magnesium transporter [Sphaerimonospora cavernae]|uniref:Magnesium transporter MgtE n=1 Tax=Sphaerimonospora cavernae TaxID=1740611 RepID=A0ABV6U8K9_9ACTN
MTITQEPRQIRDRMSAGDLAGLAQTLKDLPPVEIVDLLEDLPPREAAVAFRVLPKQTAVATFDQLRTTTQADLVAELGHGHVADIFAELDPDDQVGLLDELPARVAKELLRSLHGEDLQAAMVVLGYPQGSVGRRMSPEYVHARPAETAATVITRATDLASVSETIYTIPVISRDRDLLGVVSLRELLAAEGDREVAELMTPAVGARATEDVEEVARRCLDHGILAMPITDDENRLVGLLTIDDAARISQAAAVEDQARAGASEPLRRPYLLTSVRSITRSRIVWLLVLAVSATLTVNVLEMFEATLEQRVALALFIPLLTGIGGNTGSQAATTVTRALAMGDIRVRDVVRVASKEARAGLLLGGHLGLLGLLAASPFYGMQLGAVIAVTLLTVCPLAATVGGVMPLVAKACRVDPAVFSTPFISTFCDATGLLVYFTVATLVLGL